MAISKFDQRYEMIQQITGVSRRETLILERIMAEDIVHSTLDWLSTEEYVEVVRKAYQLFKIAPPYFHTQQNCLAMTFKRMKAESRLERAQRNSNQQTITKAREQLALLRSREEYLVTSCQRLGAAYFPFEDA